VKIHGTGVPVGTSTYSPQFRADAIALYRSRPGRTIASVTIDLGVNHETLRIWVREAEQADQPGAAQTSALEKENRQLRARVRSLEPEREILPRTATYFAGQTNWVSRFPFVAGRLEGSAGGPDAESRAATRCSVVAVARNAHGDRTR
jgi:transposase